MKKTIIIMFIAFNICIIDNVSGFPTHEQAEKLVAAAWKSPPITMDVTYCVTFEDNTKTEQDIRKIYEDAYDQLHGTNEKSSPYLAQHREETVQKNVSRFLGEQKEGGRKVTYRIRFEENRLRVDRADIWGCSLRPFDSNIPFQFSSIEVADPNGTIERFEYNYEGKNATKRSINIKEKQDVSKAPVTSFAMIPNALFLKMKLGISKSGLPQGPYEVNTTKIDQMCSGKLDGMSIEISPDENDPNVKEKVLMGFYAKDSNDPFLKSIMVCAKEDYSRVYYHETRNVAMHQLISTRICRDFDSQGFPHNVIETRYDKEGKVKYSEHYQIQNVQINVPIPKETFTFSPPVDYEIVEVDPNGTRKIIREKGGFEGGVQKFRKAAKAKDIEALKELLGYESDSIRLMSLQVLEHLLAKDPNELKDTATILKNDEDPNVREEAQKILDYIERLESVKKSPLPEKNDIKTEPNDSSN
ncbi:MAG: hypothetical protein JW749_09685 [Sedimentisphaerales bacterium]|nr:hypothetical protein [Sedimentisphaerales bacterium]